MRRWTGTTVFAPHVGVGTLGEHRWGEIAAVVLCGITGFFTGGWGLDGPLSVIYGAESARPRVGRRGGWFCSRGAGGS